MGKKTKFENLADNILDLIGGKENISFFIHCVTRLRFNVKDKSRVKVDAIEQIDNVVGCNWSADQLQIIIGQSVGDAYKEICIKTGLASLDHDSVIKEKKKIGINTIIDYIADSITPIIPVLIGCGMLKIVILLLEIFNLIDVQSGTYQMLTFAGDAGMCFLPILIGKNAAKKLGANEGVGMLIGAMLLYPAFVNGIADGVNFDFLGISVYSTTYGNTVFPVILCVAVMAPIQKFFGKYHLI